MLKHLSGLRDQILTWNDRDLLPSEELRRADVMFYLVSANSMATEFIQNVEILMVEEHCLNKACILSW